MVDAEMYTMLHGQVRRVVSPWPSEIRYGKKPIEDTYDTAEAYWEQEPTDDELTEVLVDGEVEIVEEVGDRAENWSAYSTQRLESCRKGGRYDEFSHAGSSIFRFSPARVLHDRC